MKRLVKAVQSALRAQHIHAISPTGSDTVVLVLASGDGQVTMSWIDVKRGASFGLKVWPEKQFGDALKEFNTAIEIARAQSVEKGKK